MASSLVLEPRRSCRTPVPRNMDLILAATGVQPEQGNVAINITSEAAPVASGEAMCSFLNQ